MSKRSVEIYDTFLSIFISDVISIAKGRYGSLGILYLFEHIDLSSNNLLNASSFLFLFTISYFAYSLNRYKLQSHRHHSDNPKHWEGNGLQEQQQQLLRGDLRETIGI